jgi:hypothetical protein
VQVQIRAKERVMGNKREGHRGPSGGQRQAMTIVGDDEVQPDWNSWIASSSEYWGGYSIVSGSS